MPGEEERELVVPYFEAIIGVVSAATTEGKKSFNLSSSRQLEEGWRDRCSFSLPRILGLVSGIFLFENCTRSAEIALEIQQFCRHNRHKPGPSRAWLLMDSFLSVW